MVKVVGNTNPLPGRSCNGFISESNTSSWRASTYHRDQQGRTSPATMSPVDTGEMYHQSIARSGLTPASCLQRSVGQRKRKRYPQNPTVSFILKNIGLWS
ncbi:hypothetical protein TNCV_3559911 [Trichonephila clavipes]|uniref:Uncharacterized protein n=1 Tax=Trichonephila clavipes TaxID=2585209 RepID=A0A8X6WCH6_TRICX|nr:hypothetical protein TNCV_3559911 [Trichonephila clavipes]